MNPCRQFRTFVGAAKADLDVCQTKDISAASSIRQRDHDPALRCGLTWNSIFRLDDYDCALAVI